MKKLKFEVVWSFRGRGVIRRVNLPFRRSALALFWRWWPDDQQYLVYLTKTRLDAEHLVQCYDGHCGRCIAIKWPK